jgi:hypothetical protein
VRAEDAHRRAIHIPGHGLAPGGDQRYCPVLQRNRNSAS